MGQKLNDFLTNKEDREHRPNMNTFEKISEAKINSNVNNVGSCKLATLRCDKTLSVTPR
jgi:hypothetical protein